MKQINNRQIDEFVLYSYWLNDSALALTMLKSSNEDYKLSQECMDGILF